MYGARVLLCRRDKELDFVGRRGYCRGTGVVSNGPRPIIIVVVVVVVVVASFGEHRVVTLNLEVPRACAYALIVVEQSVACAPVTTPNVLRRLRFSPVCIIRILGAVAPSSFVNGLVKLPLPVSPNPT